MFGKLRKKENGFTSNHYGIEVLKDIPGDYFHNGSMITSKQIGSVNPQRMTNYIKLPVKYFPCSNNPRLWEDIIKRAEAKYAAWVYQRGKNYHKRRGVWFLQGTHVIRGSNNYSKFF